MEVLPISNVSYSSRSAYDYAQYQSSEEEDCTATVDALSKKLEEELRAAKRTHLSCGEVLLPCGLLQRIARDVIELADSELCGLRGCTLHVTFESEDERRTLSTVKCDPYTASTFELYLTLKQSTAGWNFFLPQFLKKITRGGTVMISPEYDLTKNRLYRSYSD